MRFFSWTETGREILSAKDVGACRVGMSLCGSLPRGALLVGHSFRWRFLIGMGAVLAVRCLSVLHICAFVRGSATWGCCFG